MDMNALNVVAIIDHERIMPDPLHAERQLWSAGCHILGVSEWRFA
jgi:hypothetical protein